MYQLHNSLILNSVPKGGLEPPRLAAHAPETCTSTNSATWAFCGHKYIKISLGEKDSFSFFNGRIKDQ